ncbi:hypothetical protein SOVF_054490 [Spinacia oleracea]|uniref:PGG domain-containing protein n=1 Tax=Spinacia oleracea TaxID=3562 RepID=A0A9R0J696_SPIOL|nr:uncharacterized protein LOC110801008 [Spinacia oleracea]KNA20208.1 hypothetical protein SOVF_054490 [Spinacia oleracea]
MATMKKLARKFTKSLRNSNSHDDNLSLPTVDEDRPIDTQEQEELVRSLEKLHSQQSRLWRSIFAVLMSCYIAFLLFSMYHQAAYPWDLRYHAYFMEDIDSRLIILSDWLAVIACSTAILGLIKSSEHHRQWIWYAVFGGIPLAVFWLYYMLRLPKFRWDIIWLPFGPLSGAGICLYVDHLLHESSEEVRKLRNYMYAYKAS